MRLPVAERFLWQLVTGNWQQIMRLLQIDAFTDTPFRGNPAAVCFVDSARDATWMQRIAAEMNLSETAFLEPRDDGWSLRWFTPSVEIELCGHATLASAHALWEEGLLARDATARFHTLSGLLTADRQGDWIDLDFPSKPEERADPPAELLPALGAEAKYVGRNKFDYIVEVESEDVVRAMQPDHAKLRTIPVRGVIVTSRSSDVEGEYDFVSRFFAPGSGVDEDPVTGSAHCCLAPFWSQRLGKNEFVAYQASPRGGIVRVRLEGDRVKLGGQAVTVLRGSWFRRSSAVAVSCVNTMIIDHRRSLEERRNTLCHPERVVVRARRISSAKTKRAPSAGDPSRPLHHRSG